MKSLSSIQKAYNEWADVYDTNKNTTRDLNVRVLREQSFQLANKQVLETGFGTGLNTEYLSSKADHVTGIDFSGAMIAKARSRINKKNVNLLQGDLTGPWPFENNSFDFISSNLVLEHIEDLAHIFREAYRVLRRGGTCYLSELHPYKQLQKSQAKYISRETGEEVLVDAFLHPVAEYINEGLNAGFSLRKMGEHQAEKDEIPRLLTLLFEKNG